MASDALGSVDLAGLGHQELHLLQLQGAGALGDDHCHSVELDGLLHYLGGRGDVVRVDLSDELGPDSFHEGLDVQPLGLDPAEVPSDSGVGLVSGHGGSPVVQDDHDDLVVVEQRVHQRRYAGVEERRVSHERDGQLVGGLGEPSGRTCSASHAYDEVGGVERRGHSEGVASDVGAVDHVPVADGLLRRGVHPPVGASGAERRGPGGKGHGRSLHGLLELHDLHELGDGREGPGGVLPGHWQMPRPLPVHRNIDGVLAADPQDLVLEEGLQLLHDDDGLLALDELGDLLLRQRVGEPELQDGCAGSELLHVGVGNSGRDYADLSVTFDEVERRGLGELLGLGVELQEPLPVDTGVGRDVDEPDHILVEVALDLGLGPLTQDDGSAGVVDPCGGPVDHRQSGGLGDPVRLGDHVLGLGRCGRLHHGQEAQGGVVAVVLLVLGAVG